MTALATGLILLGLVSGGFAGLDFCRLTHRIESFLVVERDTYLVEFVDFLLLHTPNGNHDLHQKSKLGAGQFKLRGNAQVECDQTGELQGRSTCPVYIFFDKSALKFQFALISELSQVARIVVNGSNLKSFGYESKNKVIGKLSNHLAKLKLGQGTLLTFNPKASMFYIMDSTRQRLYKWQTDSDGIENLPSAANPCSALFYLSGQNRLYALVSGLETLFALQEKLFKPTDRNVKQLLGCRLQKASRPKSSNAPFYLSLACCACLVGLLLVLCAMFIIMERMYSPKFTFPKRIRSKGKQGRN